MANGLETGDSIKGSDTFSWFRGERDATSPGRRDVEFTLLVDYLNDPDVLTGVAPVMTGATSAVAGVTGTVPAPSAGDEAKVLSGAGTWVTSSGGMESRTSDYSATAENVGKFWLRSDASASTIKGVTEYTISEGWTAISALSTARGRPGGSGNAGDSIVFGGDTGATTTSTEEYNGTSWSAGGALPSGGVRYSTGDGPTSAVQSVGGYVADSTKSTYDRTYDGASWTENAGALSGISASHWDSAQAGTQSAYVVVGGYDSGNTAQTDVTEYNGSTYSVGTAFPVAIIGINNSGAGTASAFLTAGGSVSAVRIDDTREYDGATWSTTGTISSNRSECGVSGTQSAGIIAGGTDGTSQSTAESYDGATWSAVTSMGVAKNAHARTSNGSSGGQGCLQMSGFIGAGLQTTVQQYATAGSQYEVVTFSVS